jgi:hypothetical protein
VQVGELEGLTQPVQIPPPTPPESVSFLSIAVIGIDPESGPPDQPSDNPTAVLTVGFPFASFTSPDGANWSAAAVPAGFYYKVAALVSGNPFGALQAFLLDQSGNPYLVWDTSGTGSNWVPFDSGRLPAELNPQSLQFSMMAGAKGSDGNLQVVGISAGLPYLIWQDTAGGNWHHYENPQGQGMQLPDSNPMNSLLDLAMGIGNQGFLQVGYIGQDGNIYLNWQDQNSGWHWSGPLPL